MSRMTIQTSQQVGDAIVLCCSLLMVLTTNHYSRKSNFCTQLSVSVDHLESESSNINSSYIESACYY